MGNLHLGFESGAPTLRKIQAGRTQNSQPLFPPCCWQRSKPRKASLDTLLVTP